MSGRGGALADRRALDNPRAQQGSELRKYRGVELSGLEPLTSCMPCGFSISVWLRSPSEAERGPPTCAKPGAVRDSLMKLDHAGSQIWLPPPGRRDSAENRNY